MELTIKLKSQTCLTLSSLNHISSISTDVEGKLHLDAVAPKSAKYSALLNRVNVRYLEYPAPDQVGKISQSSYIGEKGVGNRKGRKEALSSNDSPTGEAYP